jgi:zinc transport system substrate-binding protein
MRFFWSALALLLASGPALAAPKVIASVLPVHGIVSAVMGEAGEPELLLPGNMAEHRAKFTPQQLSDLAEADLVFIIGEGLEAKLSQLSGSEAVNGKRFVELASAPGIRAYPIREGGAWGAHDHEEEGHDHGEHADAPGVLRFDPHVWLDPFNARMMAAAVARELVRLDPMNGSVYIANANRFAAELEKDMAAIAQELTSVKDKPYVVFHDAFQYFEKRFALTGAGSITDVSAAAPSAQRLSEVRGKIADVKAVCVFREPQYDGKVVAAVVEGTGAREGVLDPLGADITPGPGAYQALIGNLAKSFKACLSG